MKGRKERICPMKIILHACCAPCSVKSVESLRDEGIRPVLFWHNPNIHPFTEYKNRQDGLILYSQSEKVEAVWDEGAYGLRTFLSALGADIAMGARCEKCYRMRLEATARYASENAFDGFSTTLLISPYQKHERIRELGEMISEECGIPFVYRDFRPLFRAGQRAAAEMGLYRQKYCGCIFSEEERYI